MVERLTFNERAMNSSENPAETQAASLAAALIDRIGPLAQAAADAKQGIAADRERVAGAGEADALIDTVVERVDELEADCRRLMRILVGFEAAASQSTPEPAPDLSSASAADGIAEVEPPITTAPTPAAEAAGITTFPGATPPSSADPLADAPPSSADPLADAPPSSADPLADAPPPSGTPVIGAPPTGDPVILAAPSDPAVDAEPPGVEPDADSAVADVATAAVEPTDVAVEPAPEPATDEPVQISEGVRLLATQMSVAGASSGDIARRLHDDFGVEDADRLIAHLFGGRA